MSEDAHISPPAPSGLGVSLSAAVASLPAVASSPLKAKVQVRACCSRSVAVWCSEVLIFPSALCLLLQAKINAQLNVRAAARHVSAADVQLSAATVTRLAHRHCSLALSYERHSAAPSNASGKASALSLQQMFDAAQGQFEHLVFFRHFAEAKSMFASQGLLLPVLEQLLGYVQQLRTVHPQYPLTVVVLTLDRLGRRKKEYWRDDPYKQQMGTHLDDVMAFLRDHNVDIVTLRDTDLPGQFLQHMCLTCIFLFSV